MTDDGAGLGVTGDGNDVWCLFRYWLGFLNIILE